MANTPSGFQFSIANTLLLTMCIGLALGWYIDGSVYEEKIVKLERSLAEQHGVPYTKEWQVKILEQTISRLKQKHDSLQQKHEATIREQQLKLYVTGKRLEKLEKELKDLQGRDKQP